MNSPVHTYALHSYEQLLLRQPHIRTIGLWRQGHIYYAVCPDIDSALLTLDGKPLKEWFHREALVLPVVMHLVASAPEGSIRVNERSLRDLILLKGYPLNRRGLETALTLRLPRDFPTFSLDIKHPDINVYVESLLSSAHGFALLEAAEPIRAGLTVKVHVDPTRAVAESPFRHQLIQGDIDIIPSRRLPRGTSPKIRHAVEEDEDSWRQLGSQTLEVDERDPSKFLPSSFQGHDSKCFINASAFKPENLRTYVALYRRVIVALPLEGNYENMLSGFNVTTKELMELANSGRVQFLAPQSIDRYPANVVSQILELDRDALLLSRRLSAATIADARRRIPLLYPTFGTQERRIILETISANTDPRLKHISTAICMELGRYWTAAESQIQFRGAMATGPHGIGTLLAALIKAITGKDYFLELLGGGASVEWAGALGATVVPIRLDGYSEENVTQICASAYSGVRNELVPSSIGAAEEILEGIVALENDAPILELANELFLGDTDYLNDLVRKIAANSIDQETLRAEIDRINQRVKNYETRTDKEARLDLLATIGAFTKFIPGSDSAAPLVSIGAWAAKYLLQKASPPDNDIARRLTDWIKGINTWTNADAVLVSRVRKQLENK